MECIPEEFATTYLQEGFAIPPSYTSVDENASWEKRQYELSNVRIVERLFSLESINYGVKIRDTGLIEDDVPFQPLNSLLIASGVDASDEGTVVLRGVGDFVRVYALMVQKKRYEKELSHRVVSDVEEKHIQAINRKLNEKTIKNNLSNSYADEVVLDSDGVESIRKITTPSD